ncbi:MAG: peptidoglycan-binding protein [Ahrensia sp.]
MTTSLTTTTAVIVYPQQAQALDLKKVGKQFRKDLGKARKSINKAQKQIRREVKKNPAAAAIVTGVGVGLIAGVASDSAAAGIITGIAVVAAPEIFKKQLYNNHKGDMDWSGSVTSNKKRVVTPPGRTITKQQRDHVNARVTQDAKDLQTALKALGHYNLKVDGDFGKGSRAAVRSFQASLGEPETGALTAKQRHQLFTAAAQTGYVREAALGTVAPDGSLQASPKGVAKPAVLVSVPAVNAIAEYRLANSQFTSLTTDFLQAGTISRVSAAVLNADGSVTMDVIAVEGAEPQTIKGPVSGVFAEPHSLAEEWARVYYRSGDMGEPVILNTRDDFQSVEEASAWIDQVNKRVTLLAKLTGEKVTEPETRMASAAPQEPATELEPEAPDVEVAAIETGAEAAVEAPKLEVAADVPAIVEETKPAAIAQAPDVTEKTKAPVEETIEVAAVVPLQAETPQATLVGFEAPVACRSEMYVSLDFPEGDDPITHYNITPPDGVIMMDNGDSTLYFTGSCVQGSYNFSYVHVEKGASEKDWKDIKREGEFLLASNNEQCSINLNSPTGSAQLQCF